MSDSRDTAMEVKLYALRKNKEGIVASFVIHPADVRQDLLLAPVGQRGILAFVPIEDEENAVQGSKAPAVPPPQAEPKAEDRSAKSLRARELYDSGTDAEKAVIRAALLAKDIEFQKWIGVDTEEQAAKKIRETCGVQSRGDIAHYDYALNNFLDIEWQYRHREDGRASA